jgi:DNA-binding NtrC family response regulator
MKLLNYSFPGNIRQLKSVVELACVLSDTEEILPEHLDISSQHQAEPVGREHLTLKQYTTRIIQQYLDNHEGDVLKVAELLDIGKSTIYRMISNNELVLHKNKS